LEGETTGFNSRIDGCMDEMKRKIESITADFAKKTET
jgi:hypothetical protein